MFEARSEHDVRVPCVEFSQRRHLRFGDWVSHGFVECVLNGRSEVVVGYLYLDTPFRWWWVKGDFGPSALVKGDVGGVCHRV